MGTSSPAKLDSNKVKQNSSFAFHVDEETDQATGDKDNATTRANEDKLDRVTATPGYQSGKKSKNSGYSGKKKKNPRSFNDS